MGREAITSLTFDGQTAPGKLLLEANEIILRGVLHARIPRHLITGFGVNGDDLVISTTRGVVRAHLGAKQAAVWAKALAKPAPGLAQKLGIGGGGRVYVVGELTVSALIGALASAGQSEDLSLPILILAEIPDKAALDAITTALQTYPLAAVWAVTLKGPSAPVPDARVRQAMRELGYIDTKSCAVSDRMTATRYITRRG